MYLIVSLYLIVPVRRSPKVSKIFWQNVPVFILFHCFMCFLVFVFLDPLPPRNVTFRDANSTYVKLSWFPPDDGLISKYNVYSQMVNETVVWVPGKIDVDILVPSSNTLYTFFVTSVSSGSNITTESVSSNEATGLTSKFCCLILNL